MVYNIIISYITLELFLDGLLTNSCIMARLIHNHYIIEYSDHNTYVAAEWQLHINETVRRSGHVLCVYQSTCI